MAGRPTCAYELEYDGGGSRVRVIGPLRIFYDRLGTRPIRVQLQDEGQPLSDGLLLALFLVLFWQKQSWESAQRSRS
ncbi:hypothetical protein ACFT4A_34090 [Streptomyces sp. NPDC057099]|uniref:hypothetical protein n=1 Tax=Streptomyces sp. NPDC057099 TaxID=3346019 RepID=UPI00363E68DA